MYNKSSIKNLRFRQILLLSTLVVFALFFQNCKSIGRSNETSQSSLSGNGGHYEGKPDDGDYWRHLPDYGCLEADVSQSIRVKGEDVDLTKNQVLTCSENHEPIQLNQLSYYLEFPTLIEYKGGIFQNKDSYMKGYVPELWCRTIDLSHRQHILIQFSPKDTKINSTWWDGSNLSKPTVSSRVVFGQSVKYHSHEWDLEADLSSEIIKGKKRYNGTLKTTNSYHTLECISGSSTLPNSAFYSFKATDEHYNFISGGPYADYLASKPETKIEQKESETGNHIIVYKVGELPLANINYMQLRQPVVLAAKVFSLRSGREFEIPIFPDNATEFVSPAFLFDKNIDRILALHLNYEIVGKTMFTLGGQVIGIDPLNFPIRDFTFHVRVLDLNTLSYIDLPFSQRSNLFSIPKILQSEKYFYLINGESKFGAISNELEVSAISKKDLSVKSLKISTKEVDSSKTLYIGSQQVIRLEKNESKVQDIILVSDDLEIITQFSINGDIRTNIVTDNSGGSVVLQGSDFSLASSSVPFVAKLGIVNKDTSTFEFFNLNKLFGDTCIWSNLGKNYANIGQVGNDFLFSCKSYSGSTGPKEILHLFNSSYGNPRVIDTIPGNGQLISKLEDPQSNEVESLLYFRELDSSKELQVYNIHQKRIEFAQKVTWRNSPIHKIQAFDGRFFAIEPLFSENKLSATSFRVHQIKKTEDGWTSNVVIGNYCTGNYQRHLIQSSEYEPPKNYGEKNSGSYRLILDISKDAFTNNEQLWLIDLFSGKSALAFENNGHFPGQILTANFSRNGRFLFVHIGEYSIFGQTKDVHFIMIDLHDSLFKLNSDLTRPLVRCDSTPLSD